MAVINYTYTKYHYTRSLSEPIEKDLYLVFKRSENDYTNWIAEMKRSLLVRFYAQQGKRGQFSVYLTTFWFVIAIGTLLIEVSFPTLLPSIDNPSALIGPVSVIAGILAIAGVMALPLALNYLRSRYSLAVYISEAEGYYEYQYFMVTESDSYDDYLHVLRESQS